MGGLPGALQKSHWRTCNNPSTQLIHHQLHHQPHQHLLHHSTHTFLCFPHHQLPHPLPHYRTPPTHQQHHTNQDHYTNHKLHHHAHIYYVPQTATPEKDKKLNNHHHAQNTSAQITNINWIIKIYSAFLFFDIIVPFLNCVFLLKVGLNDHSKYCFLVATIFTSTLFIKFSINLPNIVQLFNLFYSFIFLILLPSFLAPPCRSVIPFDI